MENLLLRPLEAADCQTISNAFKLQGWHKPVSQYQTYLEYQSSRQRDIVVAELDGEIAGYLTIQWKSGYPPFQNQGIPEIVDFNVFKKFQRRGIGTQLMDEAEKRIKSRSDFAGIGFGITSDYGAAQILYIKRNYIPDGKGLTRSHKQLIYGDQVVIDDDLALYLVKRL